MPARPLRTLLSATRLEDRSTPAVFGTPWPQPDLLTASFAPDGTGIGGAPSNLFADLTQSIPQATWQREALRALQTWVREANVSVGLTADSGAPFAQVGALQRNPGYGDIRFGAKPLSGSEVATATPFDFLGAGAGDIVVNASQPFSVGGTAGTVDLYTALLQETGHALGLDNSSDPGSVMYTTYMGPRTGLGASDVLAIRRMYGARPHDRFDVSPLTNGTASTATALAYVYNDATQFGATDPTLGSVPLVGAGDVTTPVDVDVYKVTVPSGKSGLTAALRTGGVSFLTANLSVWNAAGTQVASAAATDPRTGDLVVTVPGARAGQTYYVRVEANAAGGFMTGRYRLAVGSDAQDAAARPAHVNLYTDGVRNESTASARDLNTITPNPAERWEIGFHGSVETAGDRDFMKVRTNPGLTSDVAVVSAWATQGSALRPVVRMYDASGRTVASEILSADRASYSIQLRGVTPNTVYYIEVAAADRQDPAAATGIYFIGADLRSTPVELPTLGAGTLTDGVKQEQYAVTSDGARSFHLALDLGAGGAVAARVTVYDALGNAVANATTAGGTSVVLDARLGAGAYTVKVSATHRTGAAFAVGYTFRGILRDDPLGPQAVDGAEAPIGTRTTVRIQATRDTALPDMDAFSDAWVGV